MLFRLKIFVKESATTVTQKSTNIMALDFQGQFPKAVQIRSRFFESIVSSHNQF